MYRRVVNFGALPNNTTKDVNHYISNVDRIWIAGGFAWKDTLNDEFSNQLSLCFVTNLASGWYFGVNKTYIRCLTGIDRSAYTAYVILNYTKSTDTVS